LEQVIAALKQVSLEDAGKMRTAITEAMASITDTAKTVYNLANKTGLTSGERLQQLQEIIREIGSEAQQIDSAYQNMAKQFDEALKNGNEQLMKYLQEAHEIYTKGLEERERASAAVCQQINQNLHGVMDVSHYLVASVASAKELKNGNGSQS
jgi:seryl-tRNA synthetase